jgi:hypothetical protein
MNVFCEAVSVSMKTMTLPNKTVFEDIEYVQMPERDSLSGQVLRSRLATQTQTAIRRLDAHLRTLVADWRLSERIREI